MSLVGALLFLTFWYHALPRGPSHRLAPCSSSLVYTSPFRLVPSSPSLGCALLFLTCGCRALLHWWALRFAALVSTLLFHLAPCSSHWVAPCSSSLVGAMLVLIGWYHALPHSLPHSFALSSSSLACALPSPVGGTMYIYIFIYHVYAKCCMRYGRDCVMRHYAVQFGV